MQMDDQSGGVKLFGVFIPTPICRPNPNSDQQLSPEFHEALRSMGGIDGGPKLFFSRKLYKSDVKKGLTRLTIPSSRVREPFLTPEEEEFLKQKDGVDGKRLKRLSVTVIDPGGKLRRLRLSRWNYKKPAGKGGDGEVGWSYVVNGGWMQLVRDNELVEGTEIQLWWFRKNVDASLGLVISKKKKTDDGGDCETMRGSASNDDDGRKRRRSSV